MLQNRAPFATYDRAVWRLAQLIIENGDVATEELRFAVDIVADVFWLSESRVWADAGKAARAIA